MKIALIGKTISKQRYGGVSRYLVELALALDAMSDVKVYFRSPIYINKYLYDNRRQLNHRGLYCPFEVRGLFLLSDAVAQFTFDRTFGKSLDVVHDTYYSHEVFENINAKRTSTFYDLINERFFPDEQLRAKQKKTINSCGHVIAISESTKEDMVYYLDVDPDKISVIHLAANFFEPHESDKLLRSLKGLRKPFILWVGHRGLYKNFEGFLKGFQISKVRNENVQIVCAGETPPTHLEKEHWKTLGIDPDAVLHIIPDDRELAWLYSNASCLVYTSLFEGFGIPPLEAMGYGCPVIASNRGSIPEVVGDAASLVDPNCGQSISSALDRVFESETVRSSMKQNGLQQASRFSWKLCAEKTLEVYRKL